MEYISIIEAASKWKLSKRTVQNYCTNMKIPGARHIGKQWLIPALAEKPVDSRRKTVKGQSAAAACHFPLFVHSPYFTRRPELNHEEKLLFDAELLYLQGDYVGCIVKCRQIQKLTVTPDINFGLHLTIGYAALVIGSYTEYRVSVSSMERIIAQESIHREDHRLLLGGLIMHATKDVDPVLQIDVSGLSSEAFYYYQYLLIMISVVRSTIVDENTIRFYVAYLRFLEAEGIYPTALSVCCMISALYARSGNEDKRRQYMQKACAVFAENNWYSLLVKHYAAESELIRECLLPYENDYRSILDEFQRNIIERWAVIHKLSCNILPIPELTMEQNEIYLLISEGISRESVASIKNLPLEKVDEMIDEIRKSKALSRA